MRIVQVANFVKPSSGGIRTTMSELRTQYEALGHEVIEITPAVESSVAGTRSHSRVTVTGVTLPMSGGYKVIVGRRELKRVLESLKPDVIEIHDTSTLYWLPRWCASREIRNIVLSHERTDLAVGRIPVVAWLLELLVASARLVIEDTAQSIVCASHFSASEFSPRLANLTIVPLGVDLSVFTPLDSRRDWSTCPTVVLCSRLSAEKGVEVAIAGFIAVSRVIPMKLRVMGDGPLRARMMQLCEGTDVEFLGHVSDRSVVARELAAADFFINMGPLETFGLSTLEAMASGTPVIVADSGGSPELVDKSVGLVCKSDAADVASSIIRLLTKDRASLASNARRKAECYTWQRTAHALIALTSTTKGLASVGD